MKKSIKEASKTISSLDKKNTRPFTAEQKGYTEEVFNNEEQKNYDISELANKSKKNTSGPK